MDIKYIVEPLSESVEDYAEIIIENTQEAIRRGIERTVSSLPTSKAKEPPKPKTFPKLSMEFIDEFSLSIAEYIREQKFTASERTLNRLIGNIMENLKESYEEGFGYDKAAQNLDDVFENMEKYELERVARTELSSSENLGMYESEKELGVEYHKWRTARDERVRDWHVDMEGQIVRVGDLFSNGLEYPGDRNGPLEEVINCRCSLVSVILPEGYAAPELPYFYESDLIKVE
jgi:SPP1 gp7 family putative phage head morphogenesis protein